MDVFFLTKANNSARYGLQYSSSHAILFHVAASAKMNRLLQERWAQSVNHLKELVAAARRVTICVDGWSKKNLGSSFLGISVCFFDIHARCPRHVVLDVIELPHPHTGIILADCIDSCLAEWGIGSEKILMVVTDNGSNIVKAVKIMIERAGESDENEDMTATDESDDSDEEGSDRDSSVGTEPSEVEELVQIMEGTNTTMHYVRMMCMAHSLQLVIKKVYVHYDGIIIKVRRMVGRIRKSGIGMETLTKNCGKTLITDNSTRWNSTYYMVKRLLEVKGPVNELLAGMQIDSLLVAQWCRLEELVALLEPFATQTDILQSDTVSLSYAIPSLLDLQCHLQTFPHCRTLTQALLADIQQRFASILSPESESFNALPAASCLLDPTVAAALLTPEMGSLCTAAKEFIVSEVSTATTSKCSNITIF
jgi:hypothetical protein